MTEIPVETGELQALAFAPAETRLRISVALDFGPDPDAPVFPDSEQRLSGFDLMSYLVKEGFPRADPEHGAVLLTTGEVTGGTVDADPPAPDEIDIGSDYRWLPSNYAGGATWDHFSNIDDHVFWYMVTNPARGDPYRKVNYVYDGALGPMTRDALVFDGAGWIQLNADAGYTMTETLTIALVTVLHSHSGPYYGIFETDQSFGGVPSAVSLGLRYRHGELLLKTGGPFLGYELHKGAYQPVVIILSLDGASNTGRYLVSDRSRFTRTFSLDGMDEFATELFFGKAGATDTEWAPSRSQQELLEFNVWRTKALDEFEMAEVANKLALVYGLIA